jgi:hypothetical protein
MNVSGQLGIELLQAYRQRERESGRSAASHCWGACSETTTDCVGKLQSQKQMCQTEHTMLTMLQGSGYQAVLQSPAGL